jgi:hypothetical protein
MALLEEQVVQKAPEQCRLQDELDEYQAIHDYHWINRSSFRDMDDSAVATTFRGQDVKVIVKVTRFPVFHIDSVRISSHLSGRQLCPSTGTGIRGNMAS